MRSPLAGPDGATKGAEAEVRACCGLCAAKEFLVLITLLLLAFDALYIYFVAVRITGEAWLPLPFDVNGTAIHENSLGEPLNWIELSIFVLDICNVLVLSLSVCSETIGGLVCSLCGFAFAMALELLFALWLFSVVIFIGHDLNESFANIMLGLVYVFLPYASLLLFRVYVLHKAQAFRRDIKRTHDFRNFKTGEHTRLVSHGRPDVRP